MEGAARLLEQLRGVRAAALWRGGCTAGSENPTALAPEHRAPRHSPEFGLPRYRQRPGGPRTARTLLPRAQQTSSPPWNLQALQMDFSGVTAGLNTGFQTWPLPLGSFLLGLHGVNNLH